VANVYDEGPDEKLYGFYLAKKRLYYANVEISIFKRLQNQRLDYMPVREVRNTVYVIDKRWANFCLMAEREAG